MKNIYKSLLLLAVLIGTALQVNAYEYFTIIFKDGTKSDAFYASDVDSIRYSKFDLDGIEYPNWQVQEIWTVDSVYRYPITSIASLDFKDVDVNKVAEDIERANNVIEPLYNASSSVYELSQHLSTILGAEGVEDAWTDDQTLFVKIRDYGTISFSYFSGDKFDETTTAYSKRINEYSQRLTSAKNDNVHINKACVYNQTINNEDNGFDRAREAASTIKNAYNMTGIPCDNFGVLYPHFFANQMYDYDQVFLITHGEYDEKADLHWIYTSEEIHCVQANGENWKSILTAWKNFKIKYPSLSANKISYGAIKEIRNGKTCIVYYTKISQEYILSSNRYFSNPNTMIFNTACQSLKGNDKMGYMFGYKNAGCYIGYDNNNNKGHEGGTYFFLNLLNGKSIEGAYQSIPTYCRVIPYYNIYNENGKCIDCRSWYGENESKKYAYTSLIKKISNSDKFNVVSPETLDEEYISTESTSAVKLGGKIKMVAPKYTDKMTCRIDISNNPDMNNAESYETSAEWDEASYYTSFSIALNEENFEPNTTYYYRAVLNDGFCDNYGETKELGKSAYSVLKNDTLTFYCDNKKDEREGEVYVIENTYSVENFPHWTKCIYANFDSSFANYQPKSTAYWFSYCKGLQKIDNLCYLNTSKVTNMREMFYECESLTSLDLSSFNTSNVTNMEYMFMYCKSLTSLDLSNFKTPKVTNMADMFYYCSSLTSLDVSNFDTSNVTNMASMFSGCSALTSLDLSNFKTPKVTNMASMFSACRSLANLDVSNFDTSNVINMGTMFYTCRSLTSLDLSNFKTPKVTKMGNLFYGCNSLTSLDVSNFDTSNVTNMSEMFYNCSSLTSLDLSNFVTSNVTNMSKMFYNCSSLKSLDVSNFNTSNVTDMKDMFYTCSSLTILDASSFNTSKVTSMHRMFERCSSLTNIDLSCFDTSNVTSMGGMFYGCRSLTSLDLSSFDTSNVTDYGGMFSDCSALQTIYGGNWKLSYSSWNYMFTGCESLRGGKGTKLGENLYGYGNWGQPLYYYCEGTSDYAHIDGGKDNPGLFTAK